MKPLFIIILALPLAGCPQADILSGKPSPYKAAHEQRMALVTPVVASAADPIEPEPVAIPKPEPECTADVFRVSRCIDGKEIPWSMS